MGYLGMKLEIFRSWRFLEKCSWRNSGKMCGPFSRDFYRSVRLRTTEVGTGEDHLITCQDLNWRNNVM